MKNAPKNPQPLSTAAQYILLALASEDLHGYGIIQEVARHTDGTYRIGPGTLYDNLKKLMDAQFVIDAPSNNKDRDDDDTRRFYRLTPGGRAALSAEVDRLRSIVVEAQSRLRERKPRNA
jgi:DNA-binding PadR family transcriptional regulator